MGPACVLCSRDAVGRPLQGPTSCACLSVGDHARGSSTSNLGPKENRAVVEGDAAMLLQGDRIAAKVGRARAARACRALVLCDKADAHLPQRASVEGEREADRPALVGATDETSA